MRRGFTLIELLAAIVILAIILVIAIPNVSNIIDSVQNSVYENDEKMFVKAAKLYLANDDLPSNIGDITTVQLSDLINNNYITEIKDSKTGEVCDGIVEVQKTSDTEYQYTPYLECDSQYESKHFEGSIVNVDDAKYESLQNLKLYGNSSQGGTPTATSPIAIKSVGDNGNVKIISTGKNLLDREEAYNIAYNQGSDRTSFVTKDGRYCIKTKGINTPNNPFSIKYKPNTQYTIQMEYFYEYDPNYLGMGLAVQYTDGVISYAMMRVGGRNNWLVDTFVTAANKTISQIYWTYNTSLYTYINYNSMLIYEGNIASPLYTPYSGNSYTITLSQPLRSLSDGTSDYIDFNRGVIVRNVGSLLADGSSDENWGQDGSSSTISYFYSTSLGSNFPASIMYSNRFVYRNKSGQEEVTFSGARYIEVGISQSRLSSNTVDGFKSWLASNPVEILYKLKTPVGEPITLPSVMINRGSATVYTMDNNQPLMAFDIDVKK